MQRKPLHYDRSTVSAACALCRSFLNVLISFHFRIFHHHNSSLLIQNNISWMRHFHIFMTAPTHTMPYMLYLSMFPTPVRAYFNRKKHKKNLEHQGKVTKSKPNFFPVTGNILKLLPSICTAKDTYFSACRWLPTDSREWPKLFPTDLHKSPSGSLWMSWTQRFIGVLTPNR